MITTTIWNNDNTWTEVKKKQRKKTNKKTTPPKTEKKVHKTRMCKNIEKGQCKHGDKCNFAHSLDELHIVPCSYGNECYLVERQDSKILNKGHKICRFLHEGETRNEFFIRTGMIEPETPKVPTLEETKQVRKVCQVDEDCQTIASDSSYHTHTSSQTDSSLSSPCFLKINLDKYNEMTEEDWNKFLAHFQDEFAQECSIMARQMFEHYMDGNR